ncbi:MAG: M12 family metallopeptidase [Maribacter sp.]
MKVVRNNNKISQVLGNIARGILVFASIFWTVVINAQKNDIQMCITNDFEAQPPSIPNGYVISPNVIWPTSSKITVSFLDTPSRMVGSKIKQYAQEWEKYANIDFEFISGKNGDIRIGLKKGGSWSKIGILAQLVDKKKKTMNFGWFNDNTSDESFRSTTMHEFGHALGLKHEHQSPAAGICWDWDKVITYFKDKEDWSEKRTRGNLEMLSNTKVGNYSAYDPKSIMHYGISNKVTSCDFSVKSNKVLSAIDKQGIATLYPKGKSRSIVGKLNNTYKWTAGWDNVETFENRGKTFLFLLKSKTGDVHINKLQNGAVGSKVYDKKWTSGWTTARIFKISLQNYLFLLKKGTGDVKIFKLNDNGTVGSKVFEKKWSTGWTKAKFFKQGSGKPYLFLIKEGTGDVHIHKMNSDGSVGANTFDKKWSSGWTIAEVFQTNFQKHLFLMKASTGDIHIHKLNNNGTVGTRVYDEKLSSGSTSASFYAKNSQQYLMLLNSKNGATKQWYVTAGGTIGDKIADSKWTTGWTSNKFYRSGSNAYMLLLKEKDGSVKTFSLK